MPLTSQTIVVKIGGSTLGHSDTSLADTVALHERGVNVVLVHGGGAEISRWLNRLGLESQFVDGLRVTGRSELRVVTAVLAGLVNKMLVTELLASGGRAAGISGVDGGIARAAITRPELGHVGEIKSIDPHLLHALIAARCIPVVSPICWNIAGERPALLNVNADDVATDIAVAIDASSLVFLTDVPGVMDANGDVIARIAAGEVDSLIAAGTIKGGMIPKARACQRASRSIPRARIIDGTAPHALLRETEADPGGTTIVNEELA